MPDNNTPQVALIADAHYHCTDSDYGVSLSLNGQAKAVRSWTDTCKSSRVFNESHDALTTALDDIHARGIHHVAFLGDYTDDGQIESTTRFVKLLRHYEQMYQMQFFALPGNHDVYGPIGKHQSTRFVTGPDSSVLVTSSPKIAQTEPDTAVLTNAMYREGYPNGLEAMKDFGYFKQPEFLHWETPFGESDVIESRVYEARSQNGDNTHQLVDASYLVEPIAGVWLLMIDANVFEPRNGDWRVSQKKAFIDSSDAGWNSVLRNKPYLLDWIRSVCARANSSGKHLIACSHYPVLDVFEDKENIELQLFGNNTMVRRKPTIAVAEAIASTGLQRHFGGHLHVNGYTQHECGTHTLTDIAVPSLVSFPPCYKIVNCTINSDDIETVPLYSMTMNASLMDYYQRESTNSKLTADKATTAINYGEFLHQQVHARMKYRHLVKDWPDDSAVAIHNTNTADLSVFLMAQQAGNRSQEAKGGALYEAPPEIAQLAPLANTAAPWLEELAELSKPAGLKLNHFTGCSMLQLVGDWYCLRQGGDQALGFVDAENIRLYRFLADTFGRDSGVGGKSTQRFFSLFLLALGRYL